MKKFSIPKPCNENWNELEPDENCKFCSVCKKCVFDFTKKTNQEILNIIETNNEVCGRFKNSQLLSNNLMQKFAFRLDEFLHAKFYKHQYLLGFSSLLLTVTGCKKQENCDTSLTGVVLLPTESVDNANVIGKVQMIEDSTAHILKDLENVELIKDDKSK